MWESIPRNGSIMSSARIDVPDTVPDDIPDAVSETVRIAVPKYIHSKKASKRVSNATFRPAGKSAYHKEYGRIVRKRKHDAAANGSSLAETVIKQAGVSILMLLLVFILKGIDTPATDFVIEKLKWVTVSHTDTEGLYKSIDTVISKLVNLRLPFATQESSAEKWFDDDMKPIGGYTDDSVAYITESADDIVPDDTANRYLDPEFSRQRLPGVDSTIDDPYASSVSTNVNQADITYLSIEYGDIPVTALGYDSDRAGIGSVLSTDTGSASGTDTGTSSASVTTSGSGATVADSKAVSTASGSGASQADNIEVALKIPLYGGVTSFFGYRKHPILKSVEFHKGIDIDGDTGDPIKACADGTVEASGWGGGYGNYILIDHGFGISTLYAHCSSLSVKKGGKVKTGTIIGKVGSTGLSTGPHLHFEVHKGGKAVDPLTYLDFY